MTLRAFSAGRGAGFQLAAWCGLLCCVLAGASSAQPRVEERSSEVWQGRQPAQGKRVRVKGDTQVLLRAGPGGDYAIMATAAPGGEMLLVARVGSWYAVETGPGHTAWVAMSRVEELDPDVHFVTDPYEYRRDQSFNFTPMAGMYSGDQQSNSISLGGRLGYYLTDRYEVEAGVGFTRVERDRDQVEELFALNLEETTFQVFHYQANLNVHVLTGRRLAPFVTAGIGTATSNAKTELAWNAGAGVLYFVTTAAAARFEFRNYSFELGNQFTRRPVNNIEFALGASFLF
jgi:outer membrane beta-barrel protein